jgi:hypothetical protein
MVKEIARHGEIRREIRGKFQTRVRSVFRAPDERPFASIEATNRKAARGAALKAE